MYTYNVTILFISSIAYMKAYFYNTNNLGRIINIYYEWASLLTQ